MDKKTALAYIASGQEALYERAQTLTNYSIGTRVILKGYGYKRKSRYNPEAIQSPGAKGVLCLVLRYDGTEAYEAVYPLNQLHATTVAEQRVASDKYWEEERIQSEKTIARQTQDTNRAIAAAGKIGYGSVAHSNYTNEPYVYMTVEEAEAVVEHIERLEDEISNLHYQIDQIDS